MVKPDLIVRSYRRSLCIKITNDGNLVVHAPKRLSMTEILKYISEKEKWITTKQKEIQEKLSINKDVINYNEFLFFGKRYKLDRMNGIKKVELGLNSFIIQEGLGKYEELIRINKWYISTAKKILSERLEYLANVMQIDYASLKICNNKTRWGSCDSNRNIKLNYRLIMLPHKAIDFVIVHELAHILEFNHSKEFYKIVACVIPTYKLQQQQLKKFDYVLSLFR